MITVLLITYDESHVIILLNLASSKEVNNALIQDSLENHFDSEVNHDFDIEKVVLYQDQGVTLSVNDQTFTTRFILIKPYK